MIKVAILIDGGFLSKIFKRKCGRDITANDVIPLAQKAIQKEEEIFRIYYYDAPPFGRTIKNPIDNSVSDYSQTPLYRAINDFHRKLAEKEYIALRKGKLSFGEWKLTKEAIEKIKMGQATNGIEASDIVPNFKQKAVDMKIGLDIAWLATKRIVDKIILITADNDFIPPMKFARKEGVHIAIAKIEKLSSEMYQHADEVIDIDINSVSV